MPPLLTRDSVTHIKEIGKLDDAMNHWLKALESDFDNPLILTLLAMLTI